MAIKKKFFLTSFVFAGLISVWFIRVKPWLSAEQILARFYSQQSVVGIAEDMLMDPLILGGSKVVPLIIQEIQNKDMPLRRYAISFLGNGGFVESKSILNRILNDEMEIYYIRFDALVSLYNIDPQMAQQVTEKYILREDQLGQMVKSHPNVAFAGIRRGYWNAFFGFHE